MVIKGTFGHPCPLDNRAPSRRGVADLAEYIDCGIEDLSPRGFGSNLARHRSCTSGGSVDLRRSRIVAFLTFPVGKTTLATLRYNGF
jgi:hypothetical protein